MNKSLVCLAFCFLSTQAMHHPSEDGFDPENVVAAAIGDLFSGPLPIVTRPTTSATEKEFVEMATAFDTLGYEDKPSHFRNIISLNEAIRLGTLQAKDDSITYEDFEAKFPSFSMPITEVNTHMYRTSISDSSALVREAKKVKLKILRNPSAQLSEEELLAYQQPSLVAFLTYLDLSVLRTESIENIKADKNLSKNQQKQLCTEMENKTENALKNRSQYLLALATQNETAINLQRIKTLYSVQPEILIHEIKNLRERATHPGSNRVCIISPGDCTQS